MKKKVIVAMSGGVDSSVAAALLQEQGYEVQGIFMKNWSPDTIQSLSDCPWEEDQADAAAVCEQLGIPFRSLNFEKEYKERVVNYFLREYAAGRTPNPDVMCNKEIKFAAFLAAAQDLGADYIATGHYARVEKSQEGFSLLRGMDSTKDQSYFLWTLGREQLSRTLFPLGTYTKNQVRQFAQQFKLATANKKDSQGICFIGHIDLKQFLMESIAAKEGETFLLPPSTDKGWQERLSEAKMVGRHRGAMFYTIGERAGSCVDNRLYKKLRGEGDIPLLYVIEKDAAANRLYVTDHHDDVGFSAKSIVIEKWWNTGEDSSQLPVSAGEGLVCQVRYQQRGLSQVKKMVELDQGRVEIFLSPLYPQAVAAGQSLVLYSPDSQRVVGGGIIEHIKRMDE